MGLNYLWDTNAVIYYLKQEYTPSAEQFIDHILQAYQPAFSVITEIELLSWKAATEKDLAITREFISLSHVINLEKLIKEQTATIRINHNLKLPDAIIAATALEYSFTLLTRNTKDFREIHGLTVVNPHEQ